MEVELDAFGLERLFVDRSYFSDLLTLVLASHVLAIVVRRAGFGMGVSALVSAAGLLVVGNVVLFPETAGSIVPTRETLDLLRTDLDAAWAAFEIQQAPVDPLRGFVATAETAPLDVLNDFGVAVAATRRRVDPESGELCVGRVYRAGEGSWLIDADAERWAAIFGRSDRTLCGEAEVLDHGDVAFVRAV